MACCCTGISPRLDSGNKIGEPLLITCNIQATAVQYLRRFYLTNSPLTHPPKEIWKTCAFLANKTESLHMEVQEYAKLVSAKPEEILAAEYKVMQALRFTLDVRQPNRGLKGAYMELLNMEAGLPEARHKQEMAALAAPGKDARSQWKGAGGVSERLQAAHAAAKDLLDSPALLTDAYFLYTPSQLVFAALQLADPPLTRYYLENKLPVPLPTRPKILATIAECAELLASFTPSQVLTKDQRAALEARLDVCRDPSTRDLVGRHLARQRGEGGDEEEKAKKRAAQKKQREADDPFGPALG